MNIVDKNIGGLVGGLLIDSRVDNYSMDNRNYNCTCECGNKIVKSFNALNLAIRRKSYSTCGCKKSGKNMVDKYISKHISNVKILGRVENYSIENQKYDCLCDCGNRTTKDYAVLFHSLKYGHKVSCGCIVTGTWNKGNFNDTYAKSKIGEKHNELSIIGIEKNNPHGYKMICDCECGNMTKQIYADLKRGKVKSCGCYGKEQQSKSGSKYGLNNGTINCSKRKWGVEKDGKFIRMRSGFEVMYAMILEKENIKWEYEPKRFKLSDGLRYTPDFYLPHQDLWIDVKGHITEKHKKKHRLFRELGQNLNLVMIDELQERLGMSYYMFKKQWDIKAESDNVETPRMVAASTE
jgi:hypothetical protein